MYAISVQDGLQVVFKRALPEEGRYELPNSQLFSSEELTGDGHNRSDEYKQKLMVTPILPLLRPFNSPRFQTYGEFVSFFSQICYVRLGTSSGWR